MATVGEYETGTGAGTENRPPRSARKNIWHNNGKGKRKGSKEPDNARNQDDRRENIGVGKNFGGIKARVTVRKH